MKRILKEPLLHFLLLGAGLFLAYSLLPKDRRSAESGNIVITQGQIQNLALGFTKTWSRPPSPEELAGLVNDRVREEVYCREAIAMGLDKDDTVIRHRLRQKMEFMSEDIATLAEPTDADLKTYFQAHADAFRLPPQFTFLQVYLNPEKHGTNLARDAAQLIAQLNHSGSKADLASLGDAFLLDQSFTAMSASDVARQFGEPFATHLAEQLPGQWWGPVRSGFGAHLVMVSERTEARLPTLAEVREPLRQAWSEDQRLEANEKFYQALLQHYTVTIESAPQGAPDKKLALAK